MVLVSLGTSNTVFGGDDYHFIWNGTSLVLPDFFSSTGNVPIYTVPIVTGVLRNEPEVFAAHEGANALTALNSTTVTSISTARTYPVFLITGSTTAGAACRIQWIHNATTGARIFLSLIINEGEYAIVDCRPGVRGVYTIWSGRPAAGVSPRQFPELTGGGLNGGTARFVGSAVLPASDLSNFYLQQGSNIIGVFVDAADISGGATTGVTVTMAYTPAHLGVDGVA